VSWWQPPCFRTGNIIAPVDENAENWLSIAKKWRAIQRIDHPGQAGAMKVERIDSSLHPRIWSFNRDAEGLGRQVVLLTDGMGEAETDGERFAIVAPAVMWLGSMRPGRLRTEAGTTGYRGLAGNATVVAAIGDQPESINLRYLADRDFVLSLA